MPASRVSPLTTVVGACSVLLLAACGGGDSPTAPSTVVTPPVPVDTPPAAVTFDVELRFVGDGATPALRTAFAKAVARWREIIVADVGTTRLNAAAGECQDWMPAVTESVNDLLVYVRSAKIDGPNKVVAQASPCYVNSDTKLPIMGFFELDSEDVETLLARGVLDDVVLHELGHVLGIGTLWNYKRSLLAGAGTDNPYFTGASARAAFEAVGGISFSGDAVPVENTGSTGTRDSHWRGQVFGAELMQGFAQPGGMPLSRVTVASLADLGYTVAYDRADRFSLFSAMRMGTGQEAVRTELGDDLARAPLYEVDRQGGRRLVRPPEQQ